MQEAEGQEQVADAMHNFSPIEESSDEDDPVMVPLKQMRRAMHDFNTNRQVTHFHKMRELLKGNS